MYLMFVLTIILLLPKIYYTAVIQVINKEEIKVIN